MVKSTIDEIKDITLERQIRKLAGVIDEQNQKIEESVDYSTDIDNLKASDANQTIQINNLKQTVATDKLATESAITGLQNKDTEQDGTLTEHTTLIQGITESLVSDVQIMPGTTTGEIKVRLERESAAAIDSNNYNLGLPVSAEVIQGTGPSMFKIQITMSSGVKVVSNDFVFTTEAIGTDVYISSFTFKAGNQTGYLSADIGLNNGVVIEANNFLVPTDPAVISSIEDLRTSLDAKADLSNTLQIIRAQQFSGTSGSFNIVYGQQMKFVKSGSNNLTIKQTGNNKNPYEVIETTSGGDVTIGNLAFIDPSGNPVNFTTGDVEEINELKATVDEHTTLINGKVDIVQGTENAGKVLGIGQDGNVTPVNAGGSSGGEVWEEVDLTNLPTNWVHGDRIKFILPVSYYLSESQSSWTSPITGNLILSNTAVAGEYSSGDQIIEVILTYSGRSNGIILYLDSDTGCLFIGRLSNVGTLKQFNSTNTTNSLFTVSGCAFNGASYKTINTFINKSNLTQYVKKMWRLKQSS